MPEKRDVYQDVTDQIVAALEAGTVPWRRPWATGGHRNPVSGTEYRGINPLLLEMSTMAHGYSDPRWVTFKQAKSAGGAVQKGQKGTMVVFWKLLEREDADGEKQRIPMLRHYTVFNVAQCDGLELPAQVDEDRVPFVPDAECDRIIAGMPNAPTLAHGGDRAFYAPALDHVQLPPRDAFLTPDGYYSTAFHELTHSTGHASRLAREEVCAHSHAFGSEDYSREELVAELGSAMLCAVGGIAPRTVENSAAYIASWLRVLKSEPKMVVVAAQRAQKAADYIRGTGR